MNRFDFVEGAVNNPKLKIAISPIETPGPDVRDALESYYLLYFYFAHKKPCFLAFAGMG